MENAVFIISSNRSLFMLVFFLYFQFSSDDYVPSECWAGKTCPKTSEKNWLEFTNHTHTHFLLPRKKTLWINYLIDTPPW